MTQTGSTDQYAADLFFPNRHAHLSLYQVLSRQSILLHFLYISHIHEYLLLSCMLMRYTLLFISSVIPSHIS